MTGLPVGQGAAVATAVLWTFSALAWTAAGRQIGALAVSFLRLVIACVLLAVYGHIVRGQWLPTDAGASAWTLLGISGVLGFFLSDLCLLKSFLLIGPRRALLIQSLVPPIAAVVSWLWLDDALTLRHWLAMGVTIAGVAWVILDRADGQEGSQAQRRRGTGLALVAAVAQAVGFVLTKQGLGDYDPVAATFVRILGAMGGYMLLVTALGRWHAMWTASKQPRAMAIVAFGSLVGPFLGVVFSLVALRYCPAGVATTIFSTTPVLILPFAILVHRERVTARALAGAAVAVLGVGLLAT